MHCGIFIFIYFPKKLPKDINDTAASRRCIKKISSPHIIMCIVLFIMFILSSFMASKSSKLYFMSVILLSLLLLPCFYHTLKARFIQYTYISINMFFREITCVSYIQRFIAAANIMLKSLNPQKKYAGICFK